MISSDPTSLKVYKAALAFHREEGGKRKDKHKDKDREGFRRGFLELDEFEEPLDLSSTSKPAEPLQKVLEPYKNAYTVARAWR